MATTTQNTKRGRPKGRSNDTKSYGPLGDLLRARRLDMGLGLADVAKACGCSVQFISNIEHGRAPLPWEKLESLAKYLKVALEDLQAANLSVRSDFKTFFRGNTPATKPGSKPGMMSAVAPRFVSSAASVITMTAKDVQLQEILERYQASTPAARKALYKTAIKTLAPVAKATISIVERTTRA